MNNYDIIPASNTRDLSKNIHHGHTLEELTIIRNNTKSYDMSFYSGVKEIGLLDSTDGCQKVAPYITEDGRIHGYGWDYRCNFCKSKYLLNSVSTYDKYINDNKNSKHKLFTHDEFNNIIVNTRGYNTCYCYNSDKILRSRIYL